DVDTPIPTPTGWKRMGDLVVGDVVFDEQGQPTRVTAAFDIMYNRPCYEVVFSDGSSLVADAEHEWASYTATNRKWVARPKSSTYQAKNFVTANKLTLIDQFIASSCHDDAISVHEAVALIKGHHWSIFQEARAMEAVNAGGRPARYHQRT